MACSWQSVRSAVKCYVTGAFSMVQPVARRGLVVIEGNVPPTIFRFIAQCSGYSKWRDNGGVQFAATKVHIDLWHNMFPDIAIEDVDGSIAKLYSTRAEIVDVPRLLVCPDPQPRKHQNRAHSIMQCRGFFGLFHDMGTGKSCTITQGAAELYARQKIERALIVTTKRGLPQFLNEQLPKWMPKGVRYRAAQLPSTQAKHKFKYPNDDLLIAFCAPGTFQSKKQTAELVEFCKGGKTAIFVDESQNFKGWSTSRIDNLLRLKPHSTHRFLFSGEPDPNGYEDLFSQFFFMDENIFGHGSLDSFKNYYCVMGGYQVKEIIDYKNTADLAEKMSPHCEFVKITDCIDMPKQDWQEVKFEVCQQQHDLYQQLKREYMICVEIIGNTNDREIVRRTCKNAASKFTVMQQVSNGWFYKDMVEEGLPRDVVTITDERARFVWEEVVGASKKCLVFARFHEDLAQLQRVAEELKIDAVEFSGRVKDKQCEINKIRFQTDNKCRGFYGTTASGGESLNLQMAHRIGYHSNSFNWGHRIQSERRTWRDGQFDTCQYLDVIGLPIDRLIRNNALAKEDTAEQLKIATKMAALAAQL